MTTPAAPFTRVVFSGGTSVREIENGVATVDYVRGSDWGGGVGGILYTLRAGVPSFTHYNRRGDVTAKTDGTGKITYQAKYEAFGKRTSETGATLDRQKSNTKDEDIPGYANEGFRFRDLETGTFISKDPIGYTLMQPADKWFLEGNVVTTQQFADWALPEIVRSDNPELTKTAKAAKVQAQYDAHVKSESAIPPGKSRWHIAEPGQPNIYAYCLDSPWTRFDPQGLWSLKDEEKDFTNLSKEFHFTPSPYVFKGRLAVDTDGQGPSHGDPDQQTDTSIHKDSHGNYHFKYNSDQTVNRNAPTILNSDLDSYGVAPKWLAPINGGNVGPGARMEIRSAAGCITTRVGDYGPPGKTGEASLKAFSDASIPTVQGKRIGPMPSIDGKTTPDIEATVYYWPTQ